MFLRGFGVVKHISKHVFYRCLFAIHPSQYRTHPSPSNCTFPRLVYDLVTFAERIVNRVQSSQTMKAIMWQLKTPMQRAKRIAKTHASITLPATSRLKLETPSYIPNSHDLFHHLPHWDLIFFVWYSSYIRVISLVRLRVCSMWIA